ncbi:MAG: hypothetical protein RQ745_06395 [Longimicrobiales bacterium]|nr:hypothetical protein [Longimicrobiales bacterium]
MSLRRLWGFGRGWRGLADVVAEEREVTLGDGAAFSFTTVAPRAGGPWPGWIALHGVTRQGRAHPSLVRFSEALAASGAVVILPDIPPWRELDLDPGAAAPAVRRAIAVLAADPRVRGAPGLIGFSFGGPAVIRLAADPAIGPQLAGVASFGGFADFESALRFQMTGEVHAPEGVVPIRPDPYARWVMAAHYLPFAPGGEGLRPVAEALHTLALEAGRDATPSWDPAYDPLRVELAAALAPPHRDLFDLLAPLSHADPPADHPDVEVWIDRLVAGARARAPDLELPHDLHLHAPVHILHGRSDTLIPFTEAAAISARIASPTPITAVTGLFAHSGHTAGSGLAGLRESLRFGNALRRVLGVPG